MQASFQRSMATLDEVFAFIERFFDAEKVDEKTLYAINLVVEELFTNMVKFNPTGPATVEMELKRLDDAVEVRLSDREPEPFDVTKPSSVDPEAPIEKRESSGMGLFLVQQFVDSLDYSYRDGTSTITFVKRLG
jgi:serine/threonine-protein kinase RsbW